MQAWGRLLRVSLAPSAIADVLAGLVLAQGELPGFGVSLALVCASLAVYHGGMVLNDWADRRRDAIERPERPLPSGAIGPGAALGAGLALLVLGPLLASTQGALALTWITVVALLALAYDLFGRGPWLGPALLGLCRAGNLSFGLVAMESLADLSPMLWCAPLVYGGYVFLVSRLGRYEDGEASEYPSSERRGPRPAMLLFGALLVSQLIPWLPLPEATWPGRLIALGLCLGLGWQLALCTRDLSRGWTRALVMRSMGVALSRLILFEAALASMARPPGGWWIAGLLIALFFASSKLRRWFPAS